MVYKTGEMVVSIAGHDFGNAYLVISEEGDYLKLSDGKTKKLKNPKRKNKKHVQLVHAELDDISKKIEDGQVIDADIVYAIRILKGECNV